MRPLCHCSPLCGPHAATVRHLGSSARSRGARSRRWLLRHARGVARCLASAMRRELPSFLALALAATTAALERAEIASRSRSATTARMWIVNLVAVGLSQQTMSTLRSVRCFCVNESGRSSFCAQHPRCRARGLKNRSPWVARMREHRRLLIQRPTFSERPMRDRPKNNAILAHAVRQGDGGDAVNQVLKA
jgi:hypothetical protein